MKKQYLLFIFLLLLCVPVPFVYSQDDEASDMNKRNVFADIGYWPV